MRLRIAAFIAVILFATTAVDNEQIKIEGTVDPQVYYKAVACKAPPGKGCQANYRKWPRAAVRKLRIGIYRSDETFPAAQRQRIDAAINRTIQMINAGGTRVQLVRNDKRPDIRIHLLDVPRGTPVGGRGLRGVTKGTVINNAFAVFRYFTSDNDIAAAFLYMANDTAPSRLEAVILWGVLSSLGLRSVDAPAYYAKSFLSGRSPRTVALTDLDRALLNLHYP